MKFNVGLENKRFIKRWNRLEEEYRAAGMTEEAIEEMRIFDWNEFKSRRRFSEHNQFFEGAEFVDGEDTDIDDHPLHDRFFESFAVEDDYFSERRYGWIEQLDDEDLIIAVKSMKPEYLEIITQYVYEEKTLDEIGALYGVKKAAISNKLTRIKKIIKKF